MKTKDKPVKRYVNLGGGPALGGKSVRVRLRELHSENEINVTFKEYTRMREQGLIVQPACMDPQAVKRNLPLKPYMM